MYITKDSPLEKKTKETQKKKIKKYEKNETKVMFDVFKKRVSLWLRYTSIIKCYFLNIYKYRYILYK